MVQEITDMRREPVVAAVGDVADLADMSRGHSNDDVTPALPKVVDVFLGRVGSAPRFQFFRQSRRVGCPVDASSPPSELVSRRRERRREGERDGERKVVAAHRGLFDGHALHHRSIVRQAQVEHRVASSPDACGLLWTEDAVEDVEVELIGYLDKLAPFVVRGDVEGGVTRVHVAGQEERELEGKRRAQRGVQGSKLFCPERVSAVKGAHENVFAVQFETQPENVLRCRERLLLNKWDALLHEEGDSTTGRIHVAAVP